MIWTDHFCDCETVLHLDVDLMILRPLNELFTGECFLNYSETYSGVDALFYNPNDPELLKKWVFKKTCG